MWAFGASAASPRPWSKKAAKFACEARSAKEATFLTTATAPIPAVAVLSLVQVAGDLYRHQSRAGPQKHVQESGRRGPMI